MKQARRKDERKQDRDGERKGPETYKIVWAWDRDGEMKGTERDTMVSGARDGDDEVGG